MKTLHLTNPYMSGGDVARVQTLLGVDVDGVFGPETARACARAKWRLGYPAAKCKPVAGEMLVNALIAAAAGKPLPVGFAQRAAARVRAASRGRAARGNDVTRDEIVANARWGCYHEPEIHYDQVRPIPVKAKPYALPITTDCSGFATLCYLWAGAPDPNGHGYDGEGFTGDMLRHGTPVTVAQARPADLVVYGAGSGHHVCIVVQADPRDPLLVSHGQEAGPFAIRHSVERANQPAPATFLSFLP